MTRIQLRPYARIPEGFPAYLTFNFNELQDIIRRYFDLTQAQTQVTGTARIATGLTIVNNVIASFAEDPSSGACYLAADKVGLGTSGEIDISVLDSSFAQSTTPIQVNWVAYGEN